MFIADVYGEETSINGAATSSSIKYLIVSLVDQCVKVGRRTLLWQGEYTLPT